MPRRCWRCFAVSRDSGFGDPASLEVGMDFSNTSRRDLLRMAHAGGCRRDPGGGRSAASEAWRDLKFEPRDTVRIGFIGTGGRGNSLIENFSAMPEVQITALCDMVQEKCSRRRPSWTAPGSCPTPPLSIPRRPRLRKAGGARRYRPGGGRHALGLARPHGGGGHEAGQARGHRSARRAHDAGMLGHGEHVRGDRSATASSSKTAATATTK